MGLDMYAHTTTEKPAVAFGFKADDADRIHYWRKHPNLHGWMEDLYFQKGGTELFNCITLTLTTEDLDRLEADVRAGNLPPTAGFFFGESDGS
ncbi:MAG TPA: phosphoglycerate kinase [Pelagibacterium sp.]|uniref:phosphoglycerate kinase n=1 Tax=Pelagibacterium sp. TaxID=1967288 RepID=UPI002C7F5077|nr:phosphoglycerate kinase [Pelagibacterium sp.]HWJ87620.1 phosphoglycerate kinase [Pelagibacterium sp.]